MNDSDDDFRIRPGRGRDGGRRVESFVGQVKRATMKAGGRGVGPPKRTGGGSRFGRGRGAALRRGLRARARRVVVKARIVRHAGSRFRAAPLARHIGYLEREGVTRDGQRAHMFDIGAEQADVAGFAERCEGDRHHFRFIVSPEDAGDMADLRAFTRELMEDAERDLGTRLDWVAVDHWNTDNPHVHVLVRGRADGDEDLVIGRDYISRGLRARAEERVTLELGPRSEREIEAALQRDVAAERWTGLDRALQAAADAGGGLVDLRPHMPAPDPELRRLMVGRAMTLERLGLADPAGVARWSLKPGLEETLRDLSIRGDIIKTLHRAMGQAGRTADPAGFAVHDEDVRDPVLGRLVERGLHDELAGSAYAVIEGVDGRSHHLRFGDLEMTGDAKPGAIVELRSWEDAQGRSRQALAVRSDLPLEAQVQAPGATWLDRQLVAREPVETGGGFGADVRDALQRRTEHLIDQGLARRQGGQVVFARDLLSALRTRELGAVATNLADDTGLAHRPSAPGEFVAGTYRRRLDLASGRFAMIDDGLGFQLVPWRPALEAHLGRHVSGSMTPGGGIDWSFGRRRGLGL
ncbi:relaxase/mobilization nuclease domain-containing protein [Phenylobacterium sp.]|uniref:relaxase/mobilization nuclease domain-containing protein n=1 Tax=Phenylobacterium sp. TaxID=1871053 RepID=UPI003BA930C0